MIQPEHTNESVPTPATPATINELFTVVRDTVGRLSQTRDRYKNVQCDTFLTETQPARLHIQYAPLRWGAHGELARVGVMALPGPDQYIPLESTYEFYSFHATRQGTVLAKTFAGTLSAFGIDRAKMSSPSDKQIYNAAYHRQDGNTHPDVAQEFGIIVTNSEGADMLTLLHNVHAVSTPLAAELPAALEQPYDRDADNFKAACLRVGRWLVDRLQEIDPMNYPWV